MSYSLSQVRAVQYSRIDRVTSNCNKMSIVLGLFLCLQVAGGVISSTLQVNPADVTYTHGSAPDDLKAGPDRHFSARFQTKSGHSIDINNNNSKEQQVQENQAPTVETVYESSSASPGYFTTASSAGHIHQEFSRSSNQQLRSNQPSQQTNTKFLSNAQQSQRQQQSNPSIYLNNAKANYEVNAHPNGASLHHQTHHQSNDQQQNVRNQPHANGNYRSHVEQSAYLYDPETPQRHYQQSSSSQPLYQKVYLTPAVPKSQQYQIQMQYSNAVPRFQQSSNNQQSQQYQNARYSSSDVGTQQGQYSSHEQSYQGGETAGELQSPHGYERTHHIVNHQPVYLTNEVTSPPIAVGESFNTVTAHPHLIHPVYMQNPSPGHQHVSVVTDVPVTQVHQQGVVQKTINVQQPFVKTRKYEIRRPAIEKQYYDIEERVIVRPAGSIVLELAHPVSKVAKGETIEPVGNPHHSAQGDSHHHYNHASSGGVTYAPVNYSPHSVGGVTYAHHGDAVTSTTQATIVTSTASGSSTTVTPYVTTTPLPPAHITQAAGSVVVESNSHLHQSPAQYASTSPAEQTSSNVVSSHGGNNNVQAQNSITPYMIAVGEPDFHYPPYVEINSRGTPAQQDSAIGSSSVSHSQTSQQQRAPVYYQQQQQEYIQTEHQTPLCDRGYHTAPAKIIQHPRQDDYSLTVNRPIVVNEQGNPMYRQQLMQVPQTNPAQHYKPEYNEMAAHSVPVSHNPQHSAPYSYNTNRQNENENQGQNYHHQNHPAHSQYIHNQNTPQQSQKQSSYYIDVPRAHHMPTYSQQSPRIQSQTSQSTSEINESQKPQFSAQYSQQHTQHSASHNQPSQQLTQENHQSSAHHGVEPNKPSHIHYTQSSTLTLPERQLHLIRSHKRPTSQTQNAAYTQQNAPLQIVYAQRPSGPSQVNQSHQALSQNFTSDASKEDLESSTNVEELDDVEYNQQQVTPTPSSNVISTTLSSEDAKYSNSEGQANTGPTSSRYESQPTNINVQLSHDSGYGKNPNQFPNQLLYSNAGQAPKDHYYGDVQTRVISSTPAPANSKPSESVHTRRVVVNHPLETVQVVEEREPQTKITQVTVNEPTTYHTSAGINHGHTGAPVYHPSYVHEAYAPQPSYITHNVGGSYHGYY